MGGLRIGSVLAGLGVLTLLALFAVPARSIQAQPVAAPGELTFFKECEDGLTGTFPVLLDFEFEPDDINEDNGPINEDTAFDTFVMVTCGENVGLGAGDLANVFAYIELVCALDCPVGFAGTVSLTELGLPAGTTTEFAGNFEGICDGAGTLDIVDTSGDLGAFFAETGLVCEIINTPGEDDDEDDGDGGIDIDNTNNNNIDIDNTNTNTNTNNNTNVNENKNENTNVNNNTNTNTQNQTNNQSQNNSNNQTNNINSSPHVNIDFDD
jgi:hypothetical protein